MRSRFVLQVLLAGTLVASACSDDTASTNTPPAAPPSPTSPVTTQAPAATTATTQATATTATHGRMRHDGARTTSTTGWTNTPLGSASTFPMSNRTSAMSWYRCLTSF